jgi:hypothetical protein
LPQENDFSEADVRAIAVELLQILQYLQGLHPPIIHRDIKPQNIIRGEDGRICLVDFGAVQTVYRETIAFGSTVVGTYGYMAPEQFRGQAYPATDLYGLGATLLYLLTHKNPGDLPEQRLKIDVRRCVSVSEPFAIWLDGLLEPVVDDRFDSASTALMALNTPPTASYHHAASAAFQPQYGFKTTAAARPQPCSQPVGSRIRRARNPYRLRFEIPPLGLRTFVLFAHATSALAGWVFRKVRWPMVLMALLCYGLMSGICNLIFLLLLSVWLARGLFLRTYLEITEDRFTLTYEMFKIKRVYSGFTADLEGVSFDPEGYNLTLATIPHRLPYTPIVLHEGANAHTFGKLLTVAEKKWMAFEIDDFLWEKTGFKR